MRLPSASSLKRAMKCPASALLPQTASESEAADKGNALHTYLAGVITARGEAEKLSALLAVPEQWREEAEGIDISFLPRFEWVWTEVAFAYNPGVGMARVLGFDIGRHYEKYGWMPEREYPGTADLVGLAEDGTLWVLDWKTGNAFDVEPAERNWQLHFLGLCASRVYGRDRVRVGIVRTKNGTRPDLFDMEAFDLDAASEDLKALAAALASGERKLVEGEHCSYCPAYHHCPTKTALIRALSVTPGVVAEQITALLPEDAGKAYMRLKMVRQAIGQVEKALREYASRQPIPLPDGREYRLVEKNIPSIDPDYAAAAIDAVLTIEGAEPVGPQCWEKETSKAAIERVVKKYAPRGKAAQAMRAVMGELEKNGGLVLKTRTELRETGTNGDDQD